FVARRRHNNSCAIEPPVEQPPSPSPAGRRRSRSMPNCRWPAVVCCLALNCPPARASDDAPAADNTTTSKAAERLADSARKSVVVITATGRDGKRQGIGTGFVVSADGLIATNLHVI